MEVRRNIAPEDVTFANKHIVFVEGDSNSIDVKILSRMLDIRVEPMGKSYWIKSVAQALAPYHPTYYFLIDRDHHTDANVDEYWSKFPDTDTPNLLIWRKKEIENYFLDPDYLVQSKYLRKSADELKLVILRNSQSRLFMNAANQVIISIREDCKANWINTFTKFEQFRDKKTAIEKLKDTDAFAKFREKVSEMTAETEIVRRFDSFHNQMSEGDSELSWGKGRWLDMLSGKEILHDVLNSNCFQVKDRNNKIVSGKGKFDAIIADLLSKENLPCDFLELRKLIQQRVENG